MSRSDAILKILRTAAAEMGPKAILNELNAGGRNDDLRSVTATISYLLDKQRLVRVGRGLYVST